jgi:hypothetical protein
MIPHEVGALGGQLLSFGWDPGAVFSMAAALALTAAITIVAPPLSSTQE